MSFMKFEGRPVPGVVGADLEIHPALFFTQRGRPRNTLAVPEMGLRMRELRPDGDVKAFSAFIGR